MTELAGQSLGGYLLEEELACGSMGIVYRGKQLALGREVAVKIFSPSLAHDPSFAARFVREAQIIAQLNHPQIVHIYDAGQDHDVLYFVMEYVEGPTFASCSNWMAEYPSTWPRNTSPRLPTHWMRRIKRARLSIAISSP